MAEQSSTVTTLRALVMIICVILIPLAAVCGTLYPGVMKALQNGRWPTMADFRSANNASRSDLSDAPSFVPKPVAPTATTNAPAMNATGPRLQGSGWPEQPSTMPGQALARALRGGSDVVAVNYEVPVEPAKVSSTEQSTTFPHAMRPGSKDFGRAADQRLSQLPASENPVPRLTSNTPTPGTATGAPAADGNYKPAGKEPNSSNIDFTSIQERLKQLGATYYLLEAWGDNTDAFRFYCRMSIGGNPHVTRPFFCVDGDPLKAMANVLQQVEDWQKGGRSSTDGIAADPPRTLR